MEFDDPDHSSSLLFGLNKLRKANQLCDVILITSGHHSIPAHRNVLTICSPFFEVMFNGSFNENNQREIHLPNIDGDIFEIILNYMYTGHINITQDNVQNLLSTSCFLQIEWIQNKCCEFLIVLLECTNCLGIKKFADDHNLLELKDEAKKFAIEHFNQVSECQEFLSIDIEELIEFLSNDEIFIHDEDILFMSIINWITHSSDDDDDDDKEKNNRKLFLPNLLKFIHPLLISKELVKKNQYLIMNDSLCTEWIKAVLKSETTETDNDNDNNQNDSIEWNIFILDKIGRNSDLLRFGNKTKQLIPLKSLPEKAFAISLVGNKHSLFVQGGAINKKSIKNCYHYNIYRDRWTQYTQLKEARSHHRSLILNNYIYALGGRGNNGGPMSCVECHDMITGQSTTIEPMLYDRTSMGAIVYENCIYVMGGERKRENLYSLERFDPREGKWCELESMNQVNSYCSSAVVLDTIYCSEGLGNLMERYDFKANQWHIIEFQYDREFYELFSIDNELHTISGNGVYRYCSISNDWIPVLEFPVTREWDTAVPLQMHIM